MNNSLILLINAKKKQTDKRSIIGTFGTRALAMELLAFCTVAFNIECDKWKLSLYTFQLVKLCFCLTKTQTTLKKRGTYSVALSVGTHNIIVEA